MTSQIEANMRYINSLAREVYELKGLLRRVVEIGPTLKGSHVWESKSLEDLLRDCREALK